MPYFVSFLPSYLRYLQVLQLADPGRDHCYRLHTQVNVLVVETATGVVKHSYSYSIAEILVVRMTNCCGMAVLTDLGKYMVHVDKTYVGTMMTWMAEAVAYTQRYSSVAITNRMKDSNLDTLSDRMGYNIDLKWVNRRTNYELFLATKDLEAGMPSSFSTLQHLIGGKSAMFSDCQDINVDPEVAKLIEKKPKAIIEKKKK